VRSGFILKSWPWGQGAWFLNDLGCNMISFSTLLSEHSIEVGGVGDARSNSLVSHAPGMQW